MNFLPNDRTQLRLLAVGAFALLVTGVWLAILGPHYAAKRAYENLTIELSEYIGEAEDLVSSAKERSWFMPAYRAVIEDNGLRCLESLTAIRETMSDFDGVSGSAAILNITTDKQAALKKAHTFCYQATVERNRQDQVRQQATAGLVSLQARLAEVIAAYDVVAADQAAMMSSWLPKYMTPLVETLEADHVRYQSVKDALASAAVFVPASGASGQGDPDQALSILSSAEAAFSAVTASTESVRVRLLYLGEAEAQARPTTEVAASKLAAAEENWRTTRASTGYDIALKPFVGRLSEARTAYEMAVAAIAEQDWPVVYEAAKKSAQISDDVMAKVAALVTMAEDNIAAIAKHRSVAFSFAELESGADNSIGILERYHASHTWSSVNDNDRAIKEARADYRTLMEAAKLANSVATQDFEEAARKLAAADEQYKKARGLLSDIENRVTALEGYRTEWTSVIDRADSAIEAERSQVERYGSYSSDARSAFASAVDDFDRAKKAANSDEYEQAVQLAKRAISDVKGTGRKAKRAYDDHQEELEAAAEAAAAAASAALHSSGDSSSSGGWSSDGGSFGSSGDGGDWGGGGRSSDGGDW